MSIKRMLQAGSVTTVADPQLQNLLDKQACAEVMMTYCRAIDHRDEALLRSVFHADSYHHHSFEGPSTDPSRASAPGKPGDFVAFALEVLATHTHTHHQLGNIFIEVEDDGVTAYTEAYFTAYHRMRAKGDKLAAANAFDTQMDFWVGGRYMDRMEKRGGVWKIASRIGMTDWTALEPPSSQGYYDTVPELRAQQSRKDTLYHRPQLLAQRSPLGRAAKPSLASQSAPAPRAEASFIAIPAAKPAPKPAPKLKVKAAKNLKQATPAPEPVAAPATPASVNTGISAEARAAAIKAAAQRLAARNLAVRIPAPKKSNKRVGGS